MLRSDPHLHAGGEARATGIVPVLKLDANETTIPPSPLVEQRVRAFLFEGRASSYPDPEAYAVRSRVAAYASRPIGQVLTFNGSDMALDCAVRALTTPGDRVCICSPCYDRFRLFAEAGGASVAAVYSPDPFVADVSRLVDAVDDATRLVYVSNPNNPTGRLYTADDLAGVLQRLTDGVLLVDEAYFEFAGQTAAALLDRHDNLLITRSLSKAFGLAGLRSGYTLASELLTARLRRLWNGREMNAIAQVATIAALDDVAYASAYIAEVRDAREWLTSALLELGYTAMATPGNFVLLRVADAPAFVDALRRRNIYIRDRSDLPQLDGIVRITVGTHAQCAMVRQAIGEIGAAAPSRVRV
jgi:histidinol-phosphate aminotransferase